MVTVSAANLKQTFRELITRVLQEFFLFTNEDNSPACKKQSNVFFFSIEKLLHYFRP